MRVFWGWSEFFLRARLRYAFDDFVLDLDRGELRRAEEAVSTIRGGQNVWVHSMAASPVLLLQALAKA